MDDCCRPTPPACGCNNGIFGDGNGIWIIIGVIIIIWLLFANDGAGNNNCCC